MKARIFYFDTDRQLSFGWTGQDTDPISVLAHRNLANHEFWPMPELIQAVHDADSFADALAAFEMTCQQWGVTRLAPPPASLSPEN
jgi:hypothetical protein